MIRREFLPRLIRLRDVDTYLGMDRNRFNKEVRPFLTEVPIGAQGVAFDRTELDLWVDDYKARVGRTPEKSLKVEVTPIIQSFPKSTLNVAPSTPDGCFASAVRRIAEES
jgi:hypothetical protein